MVGFRGLESRVLRFEGLWSRAWETILHEARHFVAILPRVQVCWVLQDFVHQQLSTALADSIMNPYAQVCAKA